MTNITIDKSYLKILEELKSRIKTAQLKAHFAVNKELLILYWQIGKTILEKQKKEGWGTKITRRLSEDLGKEFPDMKGFSYSNIRYMQRFAEAHPELLICQQLVGKLNYFINEGLKEILGIPWGHNVTLLDQLSSNQERLWYAKETIKNGWSRNVLMHQIKSNLYKRQGIKEVKSHNFDKTLPPPWSDLEPVLEIRNISKNL